MQLLLLRLLLAFGLPWNFFLWLFLIKPKKPAFMFMEEAFGILIYSIYGIVVNLVLAIIIGVICLLE